MFLETSCKIQFNEDDPNHNHHHQEPQENQGLPPSMGRFLTTIFHLTSQVLYIFWKPQAKSNSMKMTQTIMITISNLRRMEDVLQVWGGS